MTPIVCGFSYIGQPFATQKSFKKQKRTLCTEESNGSFTMPEKKGLLLSPIPNQAALKYASKGHQLFSCHFFFSDQVAPWKKLIFCFFSETSQTADQTFSPLSPNSRVCYALNSIRDAGSAYGTIQSSLEKSISPIPVSLLLCGKKQNTNTPLHQALQKGSWGTVPIVAAMITAKSLINTSLHTVTVQIQAGTCLISNQNRHIRTKSQGETGRGTDNPLADILIFRYHWMKSLV